MAYRMIRPLVILQKLKLSHQTRNNLHKAAFDNLLNNNLKVHQPKCLLSSAKREDFIEPTISEIYEKLKSDALTQKRVSVKDLEKIIEGNLQHSEFLILKAASDYLPDQNREVKSRLLQKFWNKCASSGAITSKLCSLFLKSFEDVKYDIGDYKDFVKHTKLDLNDELLSGLLRYYSSMGNKDLTTQVMDEIKTRNIKLTESMFSSLILTASKNKNMDELNNVLDTMSAANIELAAESYTELITAYLENGLLEKATQLLNRVSGLPEQNVLKIVSTIAHNRQSFADPADFEKILALALKQLPDEDIKNPQITPALRNICTELMFGQQYETATILINCLPLPEWLPNTHTDQYAARMIKEIVRNDASSADVIEFCQFLSTSGRNTRALHVAVEGALKYGKDKLVVELFKSLNTAEPLRPHYFWPLFIQLSRVHREAGILQVLKLMKQLNVEVDFDTVNQYLLPKLSITLKDTKRSIKVLEDHGIKTSQLITPLTSHLLYQRRIGDVFALNQSYPTKVNAEMLIWPLIVLTTVNRSQQNFQTIAKLIKSFNEKSLTPNYDLGGHLLIELVSNQKMKDNTECIQKILDEFQLVGVQISSIAADILRQHSNRIADREIYPPADPESYFKSIINQNLNLPAVEFSSSHILHPRDMNLEQLECHLRELESKEMNTRGVLRRLLTLNCREGKLERALQIKQLCDEQNVDLSPGMMANIFDLYTKTKDLPRATETLDKMKQQFPGFLIDEHKMLDYAALLVEHEKIDEAKQLLKEYASQHKLKAGNNILKNVWQLLKNVSAASSTLKMVDNQAEIFLSLLVQLGFCDAKNNTLLGPIIREHFLKREIRQAVEKYKEMCSKYRKTPLQLELYTLLVGISNQRANDEPFDVTPDEAKVMLEECIDQSSAVHGSENTHIHLIVALAEAGTAGQLRKLLIDPSMRINSEILKSQCEHLSELGKIEPLLRLAKGSRGLGHINEEELYNIALSHYVRVNDYEAALGLYERIFGEDDYKLSANFMKNLVDLLDKNNLEIPTSIALYAKREI